MTIRDAIKETGISDGTLVMTRMLVPVLDNGGYTFSDELVGYCRYKNRELMPEDGDSSFNKHDKYTNSGRLP